MATIEDFQKTTARLDFDWTHLVKKTAHVFVRLSPEDKEAAREILAEIMPPDAEVHERWAAIEKRAADDFAAETQVENAGRDNRLAATGAVENYILRRPIFKKQGVLR